MESRLKVVNMEGGDVLDYGGQENSVVLYSVVYRVEGDSM